MILVVYCVCRTRMISAITGFVRVTCVNAFLIIWLFMMKNCTGWPDKTDATIFGCSHLQNTWINLHDICHMSMPFYSVHICLLWPHQIYNIAAPSGLSQQLRFHFQRLLWEFQHKTSSRTSLDRLLNRTDNSGVLKDMEIEAVRGLLKLCAWRRLGSAVRHGEISHSHMRHQRIATWRLADTSNIFTCAVDFS